MLSAKTDHLVAGAVARGVMISSLYPVDTVKTRVQMFGAAEGLKARVFFCVVLVVLVVLMVVVVGCVYMSISF